MSYSELSDGHVILWMTRDDYDMLSSCLSALAILVAEKPGPSVETFRAVCDLADRMNEGNPTYKPYYVARQAAELEKRDTLAKEATSRRFP